MQVEGHHGKARGHASQREANSSSPTFRGWRQFAPQQRHELVGLDGNHGKSGSVIHRTP